MQRNMEYTLNFLSVTMKSCDFSGINFKSYKANILIFHLRKIINKIIMIETTIVFFFC